MSTAIPPQSPAPDSADEPEPAPASPASSTEVPETHLSEPAKGVSLKPQAEPVGGGWRDAVPGLLKGLATTARTLARPSHTQEYPDALPALPPRSRGVIALLEENCTSCMLCARECPDWCIYIDSHKETLPATAPGGRERQRHVLDRFAIDFSLCMYCGICIEVCPFDALHWSPEFEYAELDIRDLLHEKGRLGQWMPTVPPPPALDPRSAEPAEVAAANRPARTSRLDRPDRPAGPHRLAAPDRPARSSVGGGPAAPEHPDQTPAGVTPPPRDDSGVPAPGETT